ncbi:Exocyst complex component 5 [Halotydeus destructor]|nr:Exocyst complex component 5 [Halotydeus destructor]
MNNFIAELEQDPFNPLEFVERLAWRATADKFNPGAFHPELLHEAFESGIRELKNVCETHLKKCDRLDMVCKEEEKRHWIKIAELQEKCKNSYSNFQQLDESIQAVAAKVVYLGDQLEGVNTPRSRAVEAQKLIKQFSEYLSPGPAQSPAVNGPNQLYREADAIQKLHLISQELPASAKFDKAREKITINYDIIERELIEEFVHAQRSDDKQKMKEISQVLSHFKGYSQCVDAFIEQSQMGIFLGSNLFSEVVPICIKSQNIIRDVFNNPEQVMSKFVLNVYHGKLQDYVHARLNNDKIESDKYLGELQELYSKTGKLSQQLAANKILGCDLGFLNKLSRKIFSHYLDRYIEIEAKSLREKCEMVLHRYYDSKNHQKKQIAVGNFQELKRDIQAKISNINITSINLSANGTENYGDETFLSEEVAINILQETKLALERCEQLSKESDKSTNALAVLDIQLQYLITEHIDYAVELALQAIPANEPKSVPNIFFFDLVRQCNAICHLLEKQFVDSLIPLVQSTPQHTECLKRKREIFEQMELKLKLWPRTGHWDHCQLDQISAIGTEKD